VDGGIFYSAGNRFKKHAQHAPVLERPPGDVVQIHVRQVQRDPLLVFARLGNWLLRLKGTAVQKSLEPIDSLDEARPTVKTRPLFSLHSAVDRLEHKNVRVALR